MCCTVEKLTAPRVRWQLLSRTARAMPALQVLQGDGPGQLPPRQEVGLRPVPSHPSLAGMYASECLLSMSLVVSFR